MSSGALRLVDGAAAGAWIEPRLQNGFGGKVKQQVPVIYDAYARVFHPARDSEGNSVSWAEVTRRLGRTAHREMQWHAIVGDWYAVASGPKPAEDTGSAWPGWEPLIAELDDEPLRALCAILAGHTSDADRCFFGLSTIFGDVEGAFPGERLLRFPSRDFVVLAGPLSGADQIVVDVPESAEPPGLVPRVVAWFGYGPPSNRSVLMTRDAPLLSSLPPDTRAPSLIWPADRAWYVASEYDFDSTLVGGSRQLIDAILASPELEAWEVYPEDSLQADADKLNLPPEYGGTARTASRRTIVGKLR